MPQTWKPPYDVTIIPGSRHTPKEYWYKDLAIFLRSKGLRVFYTDFPPVEQQNLANWTTILNQSEDRFTDKTIFIGHSLGGRFLFNYLQDHKAGAAFFVSAPFKSELDLWKQYMNGEPEARRLLEKLWPTTNGTFFDQEIDWNRIRENVKRIQLFYSEQDNLIPISHPSEIQERIGGEIHWIPNGRHLDVGLERIPGLSETIFKTFEELTGLHPEGRPIRAKY